MDVAKLLLWGLYLLLFLSSVRPEVAADFVYEVLPPVYNTYDTGSSPPVPPPKPLQTTQQPSTSLEEFEPPPSLPLTTTPPEQSSDNPQPLIKSSSDETSKATTGTLLYTLTDPPGTLGPILTPKMQTAHPNLVPYVHEKLIHQTPRPPGQSPPTKLKTLPPLAQHKKILSVPDDIAAPYEFKYRVNGENAAFGHMETSDGERVWGSFDVSFPEGKKQQVQYSVKPETGFATNVSLSLR